MSAIGKKLTIMLSTERIRI